jgi:hypothetical protein
MNLHRVLTTLALLCAGAVPVRAAEPLFGREVVPTLHKLGCSAGTCHGAFAGKGGFRLSLFAADPAADYQAIRGALGRRLNRLSPDQSLLLLKPTGRMPHGGEIRLQPTSPDYLLLRSWIEAGGKYNPTAEGQVVSVRVEPATVVCKVDTAPVPMRVVARMEGGTEQDVTRFTRFEVYDPTIATVDAAGGVSTHRAGDTHILAHYAGQIGYTIALVPREPAQDGAFPEERPADVVDQMILDKLRLLNIVPSPLAGDTEFLRRVTLDVTGQLPTPDEVRQFQADSSPDKRTKKIDALLLHPLHAAVWATKLCDITGMDNRVLYDRAVCNAHDWYRNKLSANVPWDRLVESVLTATTADNRSLEELAAEVKRQAEQRKNSKGAPEPVVGKPWETGYALRNTLDVFFDNNKFRVQAGPDKGKIDPQPIALHVATAFLGVRLECAECHKHPHDRWTQQDFFSFTTAFAYINRGVDPELRKKKINLGGFYAAETPVLVYTDPATGEPIGPRVLGGPAIDLKPGVDPRREVFRWMMSSENPYFTRSIVNRIWAHYFGRGLIDPVDSLSAANPPSHPGLLNELARDFVEHKYDLAHLHRRILRLSAYQRSWETSSSNARDERNYSHRVLRRLSAEQVLDAVAQVTGTPVQLAPVYSGDPNRKPERSVEYPLSRPGGADSYVLKIFDKPQRTQSCDCERSEAPNLSQALYFYNDQALVEKISSPDGRLDGLLKAIPNDGKLLEELYLLTLSRLPTAGEVQLAQKHLKASKTRSDGFEDLLWSLLNRQEFLIAH